MKRILFLSFLEKLLKPFFPGYLEEDKDIKRIISLYKENEFTAIFSKIRFWDAPYRELEKVVPKSGKMLDLGCGDGIFVNYLAITESERKLVGIEVNKDRLKAANKGLENTQFLVGDVLRNNFPIVDTIIMIHLLHHLPSRKSQEKLIEKVSKNLRVGEKLIIVEVSERPLLKFLLSWIADVFIVPMLFEGKLFSRKVFYRRNNQWMDLLLKYGFKVKSRSLQKGKPFSHRLFIATKIKNERVK